MYSHEIREAEYNLFFYLLIVSNICIVIGAFWERKSLIFQVISALVSQKHIVTPGYLENVVKNMKEGAAMPDPDL